MTTPVPSHTMTTHHGEYCIAYTKYVRFQTEYWTTRHETIEDTATAAQDFCIAVWPEPPTEHKEITFFTDHSNKEPGSLDDPLRVAALVLEHREVIDAGHTLTLVIESYQHEEHGMIPHYQLEISKPSAVEARRKAIAERRREARRVHYCGDPYCDGYDCDALPCGCFGECSCRRSKRPRLDPEDW
jgi:hypothetical protein